MPKYKISYWEVSKKIGSHYHYSCHGCGKSVEYHKFPYCPYCGFRMAKNLEEYQKLIRHIYIEELINRKVGK